MSIWSRQSTCAACGAPLFVDDQSGELAVLVDGIIRWVAVHRDCRIDTDLDKYPDVA